MIVLPQGGLHSQFDKEGGQDFDAAAYVRQVVSRLLAEKRWKDASGQVVTSAPAVARVTMAGHSGAGAALSRMADRSTVTGDVVIYDAINGDQLSSFIRWVTKRLDEALAVLSDPSTGDRAKRDYLRGAQKLRGYTTDAYIGAYVALDRAINKWFARRGGRLGAFAGCLRANFALEYVDVDHEELMRGSRAGQPRAAGTGTILDAIKGLRSSTAGCPAMPVPLEERYRAAKRKPAPRRGKRAAVPA